MIKKKAAAGDRRRQTIRNSAEDRFRIAAVQRNRSAIQQTVLRPTMRSKTKLS